MKRLSAGRPLVRRGPEPWDIPTGEAALPPVLKACMPVVVPDWEAGVEHCGLSVGRIGGPSVPRDSEAYNSVTFLRAAVSPMPVWLL